MSIRRWRTALTLAVVTTLTAAACSFGPPDDEVNGEPPNLPSPTGSLAEPPGAVVTEVAHGLDVPWGIAFLPDGSALVTERNTRRIMRVGADGAVSPVQTIEAARAGGEGGLLGIAVSPDYATDGLVFVYYTADNDNRIARLTLGGTPQPIVTGIPHSGIHNGGRLAFGPDGYLYASTGDGSDPARSQDLSSLGGKILRMAKDGQPASGNPFPQAPLVWTYGHRNVQGLAWDATGKLFATEFGQSTWDEINRIDPGNNYGWPTVEGEAENASFVDPIQQWHTAEASCSGAAFAGNVLVAACLRGERVWLLRINDIGRVEGVPVAALSGQFGRLRAATAAPDGSIWISTSNLDGRGQPQEGDDRILRLVISGAGGISVL